MKFASVCLAALPEATEKRKEAWREAFPQPGGKRKSDNVTVAAAIAVGRPTPSPEPLEEEERTAAGVRS